MDNSKRSKIPMWVFALAFFPLGLGGVAVGIVDVVHGQRSLYWTPVPGVILSSGLSHPLFGAPQPKVRYSYDFNGKPFVSNRIWPGDIISSMPVLTGSAAERVVQQFMQNQKVSVYVNPLDPTDVALISGPGKAVHWLAVFVFFIGGSLVAAWN